MSDIHLTATSRANLLSLQDTTNLANRTQGRLSTGLKVSSALDDAVAYFQSKNLSDRSADLTERKNDIDQGISSLKSAVNATDSAEKLLKQIKGVAISAKTADATTRGDLTKQFADLLDQLTSLINDASYQGTNLVSSTSQSLTVRFSEVTTATLTVAARDLRAGALFTVVGPSSANGGVSGLKILSQLLLSAGAVSNGLKGFSGLQSSAIVGVIDKLTASVDGAVSKVRAAASNLGSNVTLLQTRLDFTSNYINTLTEGSDKLTLADLNEEGANLVALQTRQQLALKALSFAGQSQQQVLQLFQ